MLHEILFALSGHSTPLFDAKDGRASGREVDFPLLSPPEQALLKRVGRLSRLHRDLRDHTSRISSSHKSTIARAVASSLSAVHLARFQKKILDVEAKILKKDAAQVGAYNIVPLSGVVGEFDGWTRRLEWYWDLVCYMQPGKASTSQTKSTEASTGAGLIDRLRQEAQTGYPDIEEVAMELGKVAETAWLRQLSSWVLYGRLPLVGGQDFFVQENGSDEDNDYEVASSLLPRFVSRETASSILFIGRALNTIRTRARSQTQNNKVAKELDLVPVHLQYLSCLVFPLATSALSNAIQSIRTSLSRNTLQQLLPLPSILQMMDLLRDFFLLRRGEFAVSLVNEADHCLAARNRSSKTPDSIKGMLIKEAELANILSKSFATLSNHIEDESDTSIDFARGMLKFHVSRSASNRPATPGRAKASENLPRLSPISFNDFLLPTHTSLTMDIPLPFDLFLTPAEIDIYSSLQAYILALRRAHIHLASLWRQTSMRRAHPAPTGPPTSSKAHGVRALARKRERTNKRNIDMRAVWATCSSSVFLLGELGNYFEGEVIDEAWCHLRNWISQVPASRPGSSSRSRPTSSRVDFISSQQNKHSTSHLSSGLESLSLNASNDEDTDQTPAPHDPAVLTASHRLFLTSLCHSLLITDVPFTTALRDLLHNVDALTALVIRLQRIQESLDLEEDEGVIDPMGDFAKQEDEVKRELGRARKRIDGKLKEVVGRLRAIDQEGERFEVEAEIGEGTDGRFVPWRGAGVERLLMRLEGGRRVGEDDDDDDDDDDEF